MDTTAHRTAMHSSSHKENDVSEGARRNFRPDHQTTLRNNVAASDFCCQTENSKSESVKSGLISSRTRSKKAVQASSTPAARLYCSIFCSTYHYIKFWYYPALMRPIRLALMCASAALRVITICNTTNNRANAQCDVAIQIPPFPICSASWQRKTEDSVWTLGSPLPEVHALMWRFL